MQKEVIEKIKKFCEPLKEHKFVKAVWVYGSSVKKGHVKGHDIDLMVIIDDTIDTKKEEFEKLFLNMKFIEEKSKNKGLTLHFQEPKPLTLWWDLIRKGEPWAITSLRDIIIIRDPSNYISLMHKLLKKGELYSREEKSEKLLERARDKFVDIREIMVDKIPYEFLYAATEAAQTALMYAGFFPPTPREVLNKIKILEKEKVLEHNFVEIYEDILLIVEKIDRGALSEFTGKEIENWNRRIRIFIFKMEEILLSLEEKQKEKNLLSAYDESMSLCEKALHYRFKKIPKNDVEKIKLFKKEFIDTGKIGKSHYITLIELYSYKKNKKLRKQLEEEKYLDKTYLKSLELAVKSLSRK